MSEPNVLVVGQGGREHAIVEAIHGSVEHPHVFAAPGNPGMEPLAQRVPIGVTEIQSLTDWAAARRIDLVVIGPDAAIEAGLADALRARGIATLGPDREAGRLEWSKRHAKELMRRLGIPTAGFQVATTTEEAEGLLEIARFPVVLKADGLAAGKGVVIAHDPSEARMTLHAWMGRGTLGAAGRTVLFEEFLTGEEASLLVLTDGERWLLFPPARDHKRVGDGDTGPNTGGMGAYAPSGALPDGDALAVGRRIVDPILRALREAGTPYRGILYLGLMLTASGPMVLEINSRFGDPEAQAVLPLLSEDAYPLFLAAARGALPPDRHETFLEHEGAVVCVILAARGYPGAPETGAVIEGLDTPWPHGISAYHAGVDKRAGRWVVNGGRVVGLSARAETLDRARAAAYAAIGRIRFDGMQYRRDIGRKALQATS